MNTQGELFTINAGGASLTGHEVACILDYLEKNYHKMFGHNRDAEYGSKKKKKWKKLVKLVNRVHGYERNEDQIRTKINNMNYQGTNGIHVYNHFCHFCNYCRVTVDHWCSCFLHFFACIFAFFRVDDPPRLQ